VDRQAALIRLAGGPDDAEREVIHAGESRIRPPHGVAGRAGGVFDAEKARMRALFVRLSA
jgi:hypothetical protein